jgi:hypothetical protein
VRVVTTHASVVFLAGEHVYKLKKPVDLGFLDYSTLAKRLHMCRAEVDLNRRLAPDVYHGVVPITFRAGRIGVGGTGEALEYAVHMRRLDPAYTLEARLARGLVDADDVRRIAHRIDDFHARARRGPEVSRWARFEVVRRQCLDNLAVLQGFTGLAAHRDVLGRLEALTHGELARRRATIEARAAAGVPREGHGDLRLEHVHVTPGALPPADLRIIDCVEFSDELRCLDPVSDLAFLVMDLRAHGAWELADALVEDSAALVDPHGRELLPLFVSYRSAVRAKVRAMQATDPHASPAAHAEALQRARGHVLLALGELSRPSERPCVVLVAGLPGTGKSALAHDLPGFTWVRADAIRKELAGLEPTASGHAALEGGLYTHAWNDRTYQACLDRAQLLLFAGRRVVVDASFKEERRRVAFVEIARKWGVPIRILSCDAPALIVRRRLDARTGDPSDADFRVYEHMRATWEPYAHQTAALVDHVDTSGTRAQALGEALARLRGAGLLDPDRADAAADVATAAR